MNCFREEDYQKGNQHEILMLPKLQEYFNDDTLRLTPKCHTFDYIGKNKFIEIKKRNFNSDKYPDTMIGYNKIEFAQKNCNKNVIFCFSFTDGLYYYKFNKEDLVNNKLRIDNGGRCDRGFQEYKQYCYIPIKMLKPIRTLT